jgi:hypothetical protein
VDLVVHVLGSKLATEVKANPLGEQLIQLPNGVWITGLDSTYQPRERCVRFRGIRGSACGFATLGRVVVESRLHVRVPPTSRLGAIYNLIGILNPLGS